MVRLNETFFMSIKGNKLDNRLIVEIVQVCLNYYFSEYMLLYDSFVKTPKMDKHTGNWKWQG